MKFFKLIWLCVAVVLLCKNQPVLALQPQTNNQHGKKGAAITLSIEYWQQGNWGTNTANFSIDGSTETNIMRINMKEYIDGDAKWFFKPIQKLAAGFYEFSQQYRSNVETRLTMRFTNDQGQIRFINLDTVPSSAGIWLEAKRIIYIPQNNRLISIFQVITSNGLLEITKSRLESIPPSAIRFQQGFVSVTFDDGWETTYTKALPNFHSTR